MTEDRYMLLRMVEAILFATAEPVPLAALARRLPEGTDVKGLVEELKGLYANRGVNLVEMDGRFAFRTAADLASRLQIEREVPRKLSRAALETLAIIAYHQPVTRAEIEEIRGVALSKGTLDTLMEVGWVEPKGHRRTAGRPATWRTTPAFLDQFGLESLADLPGIEELKAAGLLDARPAISALGASAAAASRPIDEAEEDEEEAEGEGAGAAGAPGSLTELAPFEEGEEPPRRVEQALAEPA
ncbi:MAG TPA: SMC-Scp complex subunit ScpB [Alphaproteobacteria bacterium]|nr:SMC-Scp complex subunit ScpB [Alphaproteobacteria bacterium]